MNNNLKIAIASTISFTAGYFFANYRNEDYYFKQANEEVAARDEYWEDKLAEVRKDGVESDASVDREIREAALILAAPYKSPDENLEELEQLNKPEIRAAVLESFTETQTGGFEPVDVHAVVEAPKIQYSDYVSPETQEKDISPAETKVQAMTPEEFASDESDYESITLMYFFEDNVLIDAKTGHKYIDEERLAITGRYDDILRREEIWQNGQEWYVKNDTTHSLYEIICEFAKSTDILEDESDGGSG